jgi:Cdc6-like AAA superfamily ATPase
MKIIEERVGTTLFATGDTQLIAKKVVNMNGDARNALEMMKHTIQYALQKTKSGEVKHGPLVTLGDVIKGMDTRKMKDRVDGLPETGKAMLCILCRLAQSSVGSYMTFKDLRSEVARVCHESDINDEGLTQEEFKNLLEIIKDLGLIAIHSKPNSNSDLFQQKVTLGAPLEEVLQFFQKGVGPSYARYQRM